MSDYLNVTTCEFCHPVFGPKCCTQDKDSFLKCTRDLDHEGPHVACGWDHELREWPR